jgi:hypothetical protein
MWRLLTNTKQDNKQCRVALLASAPSETMAHYSKNLSTYLQSMSRGRVDVQMYDDITRHTNAVRFQKDNEKQSFDGVVAMNCSSGEYLLRARHHFGMTMPAIVLGYREFFPEKLPHGVVGFFAPDLSANYYQLLRKISPQCPKVIFVGKSRLIKSVVGIRNLIELCKKQ